MANRGIARWYDLARRDIRISVDYSLIGVPLSRFARILCDSFARFWGNGPPASRRLDPTPRTWQLVIPNNGRRDTMPRSTSVKARIVAIGNSQGIRNRVLIASVYRVSGARSARSSKPKRRARTFDDRWKNDEPLH